MNIFSGEKKKNVSSSMSDLRKPNKQILFDVDRDKFYLKYDNNKKLHLSNKFGKKIPKIKLGHTGFANYNDRIKINTIDQLDFAIDDSLYRPQSLFFEGYAQFPRPLAPPLTNVTQYKFHKNIINTLKKKKNLFTTPKNKNIFNKKTNQGLYFYTGKINNLANKKNKQIVINQINNAISSEGNEDENVFKRKSTLSNHDKIPLKKLKNKLMANSTNTIFGRKLTKPDEKFINRYKMNYNIYFNNPIQKNILKSKESESDSKNYFEDLYTALNKKSVQHILNLPKKRLFININLKHDNMNINNLEDPNLSTEKKKRNTLIRTATTKINEDNELFTSMSFLTKKTNLNSNENNFINSKMNTDTINPSYPNNEYLNSLYFDKENKFNTLETESIKNYRNLLSEDNERNQKMCLSFYNNDDNSQNMDENIKTLSDMSKRYSVEVKLLKGDVKPEIKERSYRKNIPKYKSFINIYKKEYEMFKLVNPIRYRQDEEKQLKEIKYINEKKNKGKEIIGFGFRKGIGSVGQVVRRRRNPAVLVCGKDSISLRIRNHFTDSVVLSLLSTWDVDGVG